MSFRLKIRLLTALFFAALACARAELQVGDVFPSLTGAGLTGGEVPVIAGRVVIVDFWASWCAPCKASFPAFASLHQEFSPHGLIIVAVSVDEKPAAYAAFLAQLNPPFATLQDRDHGLVSAVKVPVMPTSYLLDRHGRVRFLHQGFHGKETAELLRQQVEILLAEKE